MFLATMDARQINHKPLQGPITPPAPPPLEKRRFLPLWWTHQDTLALEAAHDAINSYASLFSEHFAELLRQPEKNAGLIAELVRNDLAAEDDRAMLASFDREVIAAITGKYAEQLAAYHGTASAAGKATP